MVGKVELPMARNYEAGNTPGAVYVDAVAGPGVVFPTDEVTCAPSAAEYSFIGQSASINLSAK